MKVEKVGWYRTRGGDLAKVDAIVWRDDFDSRVKGCITKADFVYHQIDWGDDGRFLFSKKTKLDLVEYLGYKKPKQ